MTWLFVDGYNIIGSWSEFDDLRDESLEEARKLLIDILTEYAATSRQKVVIVFDGYRVKGSRGSQEKNKWLQIIYTAEGVTADMAIERLVSRLPKYSECYVASSDRLVQETVLSQGGLRISANELRNLVFTEKAKTKQRMIQEEATSTLDDRIDPSIRAQLQSLVYEKEKDFRKNRKKS